MMRTLQIAVVLTLVPGALAMNRAELDHVGQFNFTVEIAGATSDSFPGVNLTSLGPVGADVTGPTITYDLPISLLGVIESELGGAFTLDLSDVQIVTDAGTSSLSARATLMIGAEAFTTGSDIVFTAPGAVDTNLIGHEVSHTVQQRTALLPMGGPPRGSSGTVWYIDPGSVLTTRVVPAPPTALLGLGLFVLRRRR